MYDNDEKTIQDWADHAYHVDNDVLSLALAHRALRYDCRHLIGRQGFTISDFEALHATFTPDEARRCCLEAIAAELRELEDVLNAENAMSAVTDSDYEDEMERRQREHDAWLSTLD